MKSSDIRREFIDFFLSKGHVEVKSSPVIPIDDPTLLFINAGMNQFKDIFLGKTKPKQARVVNSQKCIRAGGKHNDLDEVGKDGLHHTFFEMLGNWSFGDYYKKEAIIWAWELLTGRWKIDKTKLYATVHHTDKEAYQIWQKETDINKDHIEYHGDKDNFWEMGETGPCGPCSEIHIDLGEDFCDYKGKKKHTCKVNGDCSRYIELWNLVFIQYNRDEKGELESLGNHYIDTGAGFERLCMVLQQKRSNYETDLFVPIIEKIKQIVAEQGEATDEESVPYLVIADHIRTLCIAIADGGYPSNEGRGYVLRRILRRAARYGRLLGLSKPFLYMLVDSVAAVLGDVYPEIKEKRAYLQTIIRAEEDRFNLTLDKGLVKFNEILAGTKGNTIKGKDVFLLYDTFGFPPDLTAILAEESGKEIDEKGFHVEMEKQREMARDASSFRMEKEDDSEWVTLLENVETEFVGYQNHQTECRIVKYLPLSGEKKGFTQPSHHFKFVLDKTVFYAESGGQIADKGYLMNENVRIEIYDVKNENGLIVHYGRFIAGDKETGKEAEQSLVGGKDAIYTAIIDSEYRLAVERNHTATHLLHAALREVLGEHVQQKGSLVAANHLRFDFSHFHAVTKREWNIIEDLVNRRVKEAIPLSVGFTDFETAKEEGAIALFGEKYEDEVRVVAIGDCSLELCGGTHLRNTGETGLFKITSESAVAAGIRRIEAVTGSFAEEYVRKIEEEIYDIAEKLNVPVKQVTDKVAKLLEENSKMNKELQSLKLKSAGDVLDEFLANKIYVDGIAVVKGIVKVSDNNALRNVGDSLRQKMKSGVGVLAGIIGDKVALLVIVSDDLKGKLKAGKIAGQIAAIVGGKGGGRDDMAMAGGKNPSKLPEAMEQVERIVQSQLGRVD